MTTYRLRAPEGALEPCFGEERVPPEGLPVTAANAWYMADLGWPVEAIEDEESEGGES